MQATDRVLKRLAAELAGEVSERGDPGYAEAIQIWNRSACEPLAVASCTGTRDVQLAVRAARAAGWPLSVKAGGHDWCGRALCDGLVIDLGRMTDVVVDPDRLEARVGGGALAIDIARQTDMRGVAAVTGSVGAVGMAGLMLGGGYGPLISHHGLAADNLLSAEVVLADGSVAIASAKHDQDLLWALCGGGGNFGVVTAFTLRLHPFSGLTCGIALYPLDQAATVIANIERLRGGFDDALTFQLALIADPEGRAVLAVVPYWSGSERDGDAAVEPLLSAGEALHVDVTRRSLSEALGLFDGPMIERHEVVMGTCWIPALKRDCVDILVRQAACRPGPGCAIVTHEMRGAATRVPPEAVAFGFREPHILVEVVAQYDDPASTVERAWVDATVRLLAPFAFPGGYANILASGDARARRAFGPNAERLTTLKRRYDPHTVFRSAIPLPSLTASSAGQPVDGSGEHEMIARSLQP